MVKLNSEKFAKLAEKIKNIRLEKVKEVLPKVKSFMGEKISFAKKIEWKKLPLSIWAKVKKIKLKKTLIYKFCRKLMKKMSDSWKMLLTFVPLFLIFYYVLGSKIVENIDVKTQYKIENDATPLFMTADTMSFLIKREVDD